MYHKFLYVSRCLSGSLALIRDLYGVRCTHRDPCCIGIQDLLFGLHVTLIGIDDHMIRPCRKPDIIPAVISCICFHLLAGPCCKRIIAVAVPRPHTRIFPVLRHLHIKRISLFCILCCFCICRHRQNPDHQQKHHQKWSATSHQLTHNILSFRFYLSVLYFCNLSVVSTVLKSALSLGLFWL